MTEDNKNIVEFKFRDKFKEVVNELVKGEVVSYVGNNKDLMDSSWALMTENLENNKRVAYITSVDNLKVLKTPRHIRDESEQAFRHNLKLYEVLDTTELGLSNETVDDIKNGNYDVLIVNCLNLLSASDKDFLLKQDNLFDTFIFEEVIFDNTNIGNDLLTFNVIASENDLEERKIYIDTELVENSEAVNYVKEVKTLESTKLK